MHKLQMTKRLTDAIQTHMEGTAPYVAGGFLFGQGEEVQEFAPALNVVNGLPDHFEFDVEDLDRASDLAAKRNMEAIGFYCSCPKKAFDLSTLFVNELPKQCFLLVGLTEDVELSDFEVYFKGEEGVTLSEFSLAEIQEINY